MSANLRIRATVLIAGCASIFLLAFPIAEITLGVLYLHECPAAPLLPVYVMVCGIVAVLLMVLLALPRLVCPAAPSGLIWTVCLLGLVLFAFAWFLYGSYLIYSIYPPNYIKSSNSSIFTPSAADNKPDSSSDQNLNQSRLSPNLTGTANNNNINNNQTLMQLIQSLSLSTQTNREHLNAAQRVEVEAAAPHCDRSLYLLAFWTITLLYVLSGHALLISTCVFGINKLSKIIVI